MASRFVGANAPKPSVFLAALLVLVGAACDAPAARGPASTLPRWEGHAREVFDDNIEASAMGLAMEGLNPLTDRNLRERVQTAEFVARMRVRTVTVDTVGERSTYHLELESVAPLLAGKKPSDSTIEVSVGASAPAYSITKAFDSRLRGHAFIGFVRHFASESGDSELHWHLAADNADVAAAVDAAGPH